MSSLGAVLLMTASVVFAIVVAPELGIKVPSWSAPLVLLAIPLGWVLDDFMGWSGGHV